MQSLPLVALLARATFSGLWSQNCLIGGHVFGGHVLRDDIFMVGHILQKKISHRRTFLTGGHTYGRICLMGECLTYFK